MGYQVTMTRAGYELQAKLFAEGGDFTITRVEVGSGIWPQGTDLLTVSRLAQSRCAATSTTPRREGCEVSLSVEYRSDLTPGLDRPFQINEFGVFALGAEGTEILLLYGDLSDYPETAVPQQYGGCVRRYPIHVTIGPDANASLDYPAGAWVTWEELVETMGLLAVRRMDVTIPAKGWVSSGSGRYPFRRDIPVDTATAKMVPGLTVLEEGEAAAVACDLAPRAQTLEGVVRVFAAAVPTVPIPASLVLMGDSSGLILSGGGAGGGSFALPAATAGSLGAIKVGSGLSVSDDGTLSVNSATEADVDRMTSGLLGRTTIKPGCIRKD